MPSFCLVKGSSSQAEIAYNAVCKLLSQHTSALHQPQQWVSLLQVHEHEHICKTLRLCAGLEAAPSEGPLLECPAAF